MWTKQENDKIGYLLTKVDEQGDAIQKVMTSLAVHIEGVANDRERIDATAKNVMMILVGAEGRNGLVGDVRDAKSAIARVEVKSQMRLSALWFPALAGIGSALGSVLLLRAFGI